MFRLTYINGRPVMSRTCDNLDSTRRYILCVLKVWRKCKYRVVTLGKLNYVALHGTFAVQIKAERMK